MQNLSAKWFVSGCLIFSSLLVAHEWLDDESLVLSMEEPEILVSMTGVVQLQVLDRDPENPEEGTFEWWVLLMDGASFEKACTTPVHGSFQDPASIRNASHSHELGLTGDYDFDFLRKNLGQTVTLLGYLWHAHTHHHPSVVMMDTDPW
jgi:hypothetical protein